MTAFCALLAQALARGELSYAKVRALTRVATPETEDPPTLVQQQADALALLAETALHHGIDPGDPGERYQVVVHVDAEVLADADASGQSVLEDGACVPAGTSQRLACDASRVVMRPDGYGEPCTIATGVAASRAAACGSDRAITSVTGPRAAPPRSRTLLCRRHHRAVHEEGYQVDRQEDGELHFRPLILVARDSIDHVGAPHSVR